MKIKKRLPVGSQVLGGVSVLCGTYLLWGLAIALLVFGVCAVVVGYLFEGGDENGATQSRGRTEEHEDR